MNCGYSFTSSGSCTERVCVPSANKYYEQTTSNFKIYNQYDSETSFGHVCGNDITNPTAPGTSCVGEDSNRYCTILQDSNTRRCCYDGYEWNTANDQCTKTQDVYECSYTGGIPDKYNDNACNALPNTICCPVFQAGFDFTCGNTAAYIQVY